MYACARKSRHAWSHDFTTLSKVEVGGIKSKVEVEESSPNGGGGIKSKVEVEVFKSKVEVEWRALKANFWNDKLFKRLYRLHISRDLWRHKIIVLTRPNQRLARHSTFMHMRNLEHPCTCAQSPSTPLQTWYLNRHPPPPLPKKWSLHYHHPPPPLQTWYHLHLHYLKGGASTIKKWREKSDAHAQEDHTTHRTVTILSHVIKWTR